MRETLESSTGNRLKKAGALASMIAAIAVPTANARPEIPAARLPMSTLSAEKSPKPQKLLEQLPGYGIEVSKKTQERLRDSTVQIIAQIDEGQYKGSYHFVCSGTKISDNEVDTAAHCAQEVTGNQSGVIKTQHPAENIIMLAEAKGLKYLIVDPKLPIRDATTGLDVRATQPIAEVTGMSVAQNKDWMRLRVQPIPLKADGQNVSNAARSFDSIPVFKAQRGGLSKEPEIGQAVTVSAVPEYPDEVNGPTGQAINSLISTKGYWLGSLDLWNGRYDAVGIKTEVANGLIICSSGSSGSGVGADVGGKQDKQYLSGPLSVGDTLVVTWWDLQRNKNTPGITPEDIKKIKEENTAKYSRSLGIDLKASGIVELCFYPKNTGHISEELERGFSYPIKP